MMRRWGFIILVFVWSNATAPSPSQANQRPELAAIVAASIDQHIIPSYKTLQSASEKLNANIAAWCEDGGGGAESPARATVEDSFRKSVSAWGGVAFLRFGPARKDSRQQHLAFFPDPRGVASRQLSAALKRKDPALLEPGALSQQSAAIQGLPALEVLLFPKGPETKSGLDDYGCGLAMAISANVARLSHELTEEWTSPDGWRTRMVETGPDNPVYKSDAEAAGELVKALLTGLQIVRDLGFEAMLQAEQRGRTRAGLAFERSGVARDFMLASIRSCGALAQTLRLGDFVAGDSKVGWISGWIGNAFRSLASDAEEMPMPGSARPTLGNTEGPNRVRRGKFYANGLRQIIGRQIAPTAGLTLGFNELDGD
ncbi:imelysin family protein [Filomicrobium sp.]|uniref:imelysin family protein n=1 Tax=Filomicrobium sp. TaxID=2024831 RepID=UPI002590487E|nr:imelysin family protein [Filomicrobium sp.]MCV0370125.1 imelysin family protein [Filomicrobium sp.]